MGATNFHNIELGKDAKTAFNKAVEQALWEYGHGGYTGTIAEKGGFVDCGQLGRNYADHIEGHIFNVQDAGYEQWDEKSKRWRVDEKAKQRAINKVPETIRKQVLKAAPIHDDKWGPAVCFEIVGTKAKAIKERYGRKGTHDKVFLFIGMASE